LQDTFGINMVALIDGQPKLCNLRDLVQVFLEHRREVVTRRTVFELRKARDRGHLLEGLAVALANIDEFIRIIRNAPTPPVAKAELMSKVWDSKIVKEMLTRTRADGSAVNADDYRPNGMEREFGMQKDGLYRLSEAQTTEILNMRLQRLTGLEQDKIVAEYKEVMSVIEDLLDILSKPERVSVIISDELIAIKTEFGQTKLGARRSQIEHNAQDMSTEDLITPTDMVAAASRLRRPKKMTGLTSCLSPTHTIIYCASPTGAACTGSRCGKCLRAPVARVAGRLSICSRCKRAKKSTWYWHSRVTTAASRPITSSSWPPAWAP